MNDNYTDQNGNKVYRNTIIADQVCFCGDKSGAGSGEQTGGTDPPRQTAPQKPAPQPAAQKPAPQQEQIELGDLSDFEEILSDGEVPF